MKTLEQLEPKDGLDIWRMRGVLDKARREHMRTVMADYDREHYAQMKQLREACERLTGHAFQFSHCGPLGHPWSYCTHCGASKVDQP